MMTNVTRLLLCLCLLVAPGIVAAQTCPTEPAQGWTGTFGDSYATFAAIRAAYVATGENGYDFRAEQWQAHTNGNYAYYIYWNTAGTTTYSGQYYWIMPNPASQSSTDPGYLGCAAAGPATTAEQCAGFKADPAFGPRDATYTTATPCIGGCALAKVSGEPGFAVTVAGVTQHWGKYELTGGTCPQTQGAPSIETAKVSETPPNACVSAGSGQTYCTRSDGKQCYSASSGRQICWGVAETGTKRDSNVAQVRCTGTSPCTAPTISGETTTATGTATTVTTTSTSSTSTTTVNNYTTTNPAPQNAGEAAANTAASKTATGGSCDSSYICSGDAIACASLEEQRKTRCAIEHKGEGITGGDDCLDAPLCTGAKCDASAYAITVQTWEAQCATKALGDKATATNSKLDAIKTAIEGIPGGTGTGTGTIEDNGTVPGSDESGTGESNGHNVATEFGVDGLDESGRGMARSCPTLPPIFFQNTTMQFDISWLCTGGEIESVILLLVVAVFCLRYIGAA